MKQRRAFKKGGIFGGILAKTLQMYYLKIMEIP